MSEWFRIIVFVLQLILHKDKPLFGKIKNIAIFVTDGIRTIEIDWDFKNGPRYFNGK